MKSRIPVRYHGFLSSIEHGDIRLLKSPLIIIALLAFQGPPAGGAERMYGGRALDAWRRELIDFDAASPQAAEKAPPLIEILGDPALDEGIRRDAAMALSRIGQPAQAAVPKLVTLLDSTEGEPGDAPFWAAKALAQFGPLAKEATPALVALVHDVDRPLAHRQMVLEALAMIRGAHPSAVRALIDVVNTDAPLGGEDDDASRLRSSAVEALGIAGADAAVAAPLLVRIIRNPREAETIRRRSVTALGAMGSAADIAVEPLAEALLIDDSEAVRDAAAESLAELGPPGQVMLLRTAKHNDARIRWRAAKALGRINKPDEDVVVALQAAVRDADEQVRLHAAESLWIIVADADPILPVVVQLLTSDDRNVRIRAIELLDKFGPQAKPVEGELEKLAGDKRQPVRRAAETALRNLRGHKSPSPRGRGSG